MRSHDFDKGLQFNIACLSYFPLECLLMYDLEKNRLALITHKRLCCGCRFTRYVSLSVSVSLLNKCTKRRSLCKGVISLHRLIVRAHTRNRLWVFLFLLPLLLPASTGKWNFEANMWPQPTLGHKLKMCCCHWTLSKSPALFASAWNIIYEFDGCEYNDSFVCSTCDVIQTSHTHS